MSPEQLRIRRPDDWHVHLRDGALLRAVVADTARTCGRAIVMPNLQPPVTSAAQAEAYRARILDARPPGSSFEPLMTVYLTDRTDRDDLKRGLAEASFVAAKLYPAGATTHSEHGVSNIGNIHAVLETMQTIGLPLLVHGEVTDPAVDIFDREAIFIERVLDGVRHDFPELRIVFEHVTTAEAVDYVRSCPTHLAATVTPHHLLINRNDLFSGGLRPHRYCLPVAKREHHRLALRAAVTSGDTRFFIGTDSAPHLSQTKESACGCAGIYNAPTALACYARVFDEEHALDRLEGFVSLHGPRFYGLEPNEDFVTMRRATVAMPVREPRVDGDHVRVFNPPAAAHWQVETGQAATPVPGQRDTCA